MCFDAERHSLSEIQEENGLELKAVSQFEIASDKRSYQQESRFRPFARSMPRSVLAVSN